MNVNSISAFSEQDAEIFLDKIKTGEVTNDSIMKTFQEIPEGFPTNEKYTEIVSAIQTNYPSIYRQAIEKDM